MNQIQDKQIQEVERRYAIFESMINSMTKKEREQPELLAKSPSRRWAPPPRPLPFFPQVAAGAGLCGMRLECEPAPGADRASRRAGRGVPSVQATRRVRARQDRRDEIHQGRQRAAASGAPGP